jgi:hypothetical protein
MKEHSRRSSRWEYGELEGARPKFAITRVGDAGDFD